MMDRTNSQPTLEGVQEKSLKDIAIYALLIFIGLWIGLMDVRSSGVQWLEDGSRYANNGAMMRDWIVSGQYTDPYEFAKNNTCDSNRKRDCLQIMQQQMQWLFEKNKNSARQNNSTCAIK